MYQALLTRRYLTSKVMPLLAALAVVLCTAMVLIVWSVMGGFLVKLVDSGRTMIGDVLIAWPNSGFAYYDDLTQRLEKDPMVAGAAPLIEAYGLINLPDGRSESVIVKGIHGPSYAKVTDYTTALWWKPIDEPLRKDVDRLDPRLDPTKTDLFEQLLKNGLSLTRPDPATGITRPAVVLGIEVTGYNKRFPSGVFVPQTPVQRSTAGQFQQIKTFMPTMGTVTISLPPRDSKGLVVNMVTRQFPVANEFHSGIYEIDHRTVLMELSAAQAMLQMNAATRLEGDPTRPVRIIIGEGGTEQIVEPTVTVEDPARVTHVIVRGRAEQGGGADADKLAERCREIYAQFAQAHEGKVPDEFAIRISTWEDQNRILISAVRKETGLVLSIFSFISMTAVFLVLAIFWSMVSERTKDVGVLRAIGASRRGIAAVWLLYGLAIGIVGSLLGGTLAYVIVTNINPIHEWMGESLGLYIWDPRVYYFSEIPHKVEPDKMAYVLIGGLVSSVLGALIPAIRAAMMDPVKSLRFE